MDKKWSEETLLNLIKDYRANPCLWNFKAPGYTNKVKRNAALRTLAEKYDSDVDQIKWKIKRLRASFVEKVNKVRYQRSMEGTDSTSDWFAYRAMSFLLKNNCLKLKRDSQQVKRKWSKEIVLRFIDDYRANPCLWNFKMLDYENNVMKGAVLCRLAKKYDYDVNYIKMKISSLRQIFKKEHNRRIRGIDLIPSWYGYRPLSFLLNLQDENLEFEEHDEEKLRKQNGTMDTDEIESDGHQSKDSEQTVEYFSPGTPFSQSTDETADEYEPRIKMSTRKRPAQYDSTTEDNSSDEDSKFSKSILPHSRKIPQHKKLLFRNKVLELVQKFAYNG